MTFVTFLLGVAATAFLASGLFFLKFWKASRDKFFMYFSLACFFLGIERILLVAIMPQYIDASPPEAHAYIYLLRLMAYVLILAGVIQRNRRAI